MDDIYIKALKEREELQKRISDLDRFLELYRELSGGAGAFYATNASVENRPLASESGPAQAKPGPRLKRVSPKELVECATNIIRTGRRPLTRGELVPAIEGAGLLVPGKDKETKARYLGTILWRHRDVFRNIEGKGYWLTDMPDPIDPVLRDVEVAGQQLFEMKYGTK